MKKIFLSILILLTISSVAFAQKDSSFRVGGAFAFEMTTGDLSEFVGTHVGGGVQAEYDLGLSLPSFMKVGISAKVMANFGSLKDDILLSMWNLQIAPGVYGRFGFGDLAIQPEISYGVQMNFLKQNPEYNNKIDSMYLDQMIEAAVGIRYSPKKLLNGALEFGVTPFYVFCPEKNYSASYFGANVFVFYKL